MTQQQFMIICTYLQAFVALSNELSLFQLRQKDKYLRL